MAEAIYPPPIIPQRRPRDQPEVIDVDLLDDEDIIITGYGRSQRRRLSNGQVAHSRASASRSNNHEVIVLSDDEGEGSYRASGIVLPLRYKVGPRRRLLSPPPPPMQAQRPPPIPPFPLRLLFPRRSRSHAPQPPPAPPVIIPNANPFDFEAHIQAPPPPRQPTPPVLPPRGAPVSHHQPSMGLGGAILAFNRSVRSNAGAVSGHSLLEPHPPRQSRAYGVYSWLSEMLESGFRRPEPRPRADYDAWPLADLPFGFDEDMPSMDELLAQVRQPKSTEIMWKPEYTHDGPAHPGYTYHFAEEAPTTTSASSPGSSSAQAIVIVDDGAEINAAGSSSDVPADAGRILVCSQCSDALLLPDERDKLSVEEQRSQRVWGLRCGHILDGKCIHSIMRPPISASAEVAEVGKGKGKGRMVEADNPSGFSSKRRGRGKNFAGLEYRKEEEDGPENPMRSRLRPRHPRADAAPSSSLDFDLEDDRPISSLLAPTSPRRREARESRASHPYSKAKGKGRTRKPVVLEEFEWTCPVSGCGHVHRSVHMKGGDESIDGGWTMDPEKGAIAMFI
ncbi:hypothetical protein BXZ70DRAFT_988367 [Cristinia sonorae]|uniref:Uncharacterized protein n=1 Tax=Cristinia sonorae TaxID=1940300 RepID=A0A8K0UPM2_9AGAR|nr:hypothetical protein BXZ70DRAFT_988367 [Cristinia sonorae]